MQWTFYGIYTTRYITLQDLDLAITGRDGGLGGGGGVQGCRILGLQLLAPRPGAGRGNDAWLPPSPAAASAQ